MLFALARLREVRNALEWRLLQRRGVSVWQGIHEGVNAAAEQRAVGGRVARARPGVWVVGMDVRGCINEGEERS